jgi:predicted acylesterase/phospholipase RssA
MSGCIVLDADKELNWESIKRLWERDQVKFLFVKPYSMSGYIMPLYALRSVGIDVTTKPTQLEFTNSPGASLSKLISEGKEALSGHQHLVAFVQDNAVYDPTATKDLPGGFSDNVFRRIPLDGLKNYIPREIILANYNQTENDKFAQIKLLVGQLLEKWSRKRGSNGGQRASTQSGAGSVNTVVTEIAMQWQKRENWSQEYSDVIAALNSTRLPKQFLYRSSFNDLLRDLHNYNSPRLALVLSGGGAKCAYQAGAIIEIERRLAEWNKTQTEEALARHLTKPKDLDIDLVVGTSGGAINALLVALRVTQQNQAKDSDDTTRIFAHTWQSFKQKQFLRPSRQFKFFFGVCLGLLQSLLIIGAVQIFGRQAMSWPATIRVLVVLDTVQIVVAWYFRVGKWQVFLLLFTEALAVAFIAIIVYVFDCLTSKFEKLVSRRRLLNEAKSAEADGSPSTVSAEPNEELWHWRKLTILLMIAFGLFEGFLMLVPEPPNIFLRLTHHSHWVEHLWTITTLASAWSFPVPLVIALCMAVIGSLIFHDFNWNRSRERVVWWLSIVVAVISCLLLLQLFFKESSPSTSEGIEELFNQEIPRLLRGQISLNAGSTVPPETALKTISTEIMDHNLLTRDLIITTSKLPVTESAVPEVQDRDFVVVNSLPDDLYFYFKKSDSNWVVPSDRRFVPLKFNRDKLLDVVIGSSTIYPIFPSRLLPNLVLGNEDGPSKLSIKGDVRVIDGGFIHNTPIEAAKKGHATHIILIGASPATQYRDPRDFWDNAGLAFGYLFAQAQRSDTLEVNAETFELRPTSQCEKNNIRPICIDTEPDGNPEPDMDTFDFSEELAREAFDRGAKDVMRENPPLFSRIPGPPDFRPVSRPRYAKP